MGNSINIVNKNRIAEKNDRLASSLRDNLSKRKTQQKSRVLSDKKIDKNSDDKLNDIIKNVLY